MTKYKASPHYTIQAGDKVITFDYFGNYETDNKDEIAILDSNVPRYVKKVGEETKPKAEEKPKQAEASETKPKSTPTKRKSTAK